MRKELQIGLDLCRFPETEGTLEGEQLELLQSVLDRLERCTPVSSEPALDPAVRICINLLMHLASQVPLASRPMAEL